MPGLLGLRPGLGQQVPWLAWYQDGCAPPLLVGPERAPPFYGPESKGLELAWAMPHCWAGHAADAQPWGPVPWAGRGYFWDRAGALGLVSDVPM